MYEALQMMNCLWDRWVEVEDTVSRCNVYAAPALRVGKPSQATQITEGILYTEDLPTGRGRNDRTNMEEKRACVLYTDVIC